MIKTMFKKINIVYFLILISNYALADYSPRPTFMDTNGAVFSSAQASCSSTASIRTSNNVYGVNATFTYQSSSISLYDYNGQASVTCNIQATWSNGGQIDHVGNTAFANCANGFSATTQMCAGLDPNAPNCVAPQVLDSGTNQCYTPAKCDTKKNNPTNYSLTSPSGGNVCQNGCEVAMSQGSCANNPSGQTLCAYSGFYTGADCSGNPTDNPSTSTAPNAPPTPDTPEYNCLSKGQSYGTVNGKTVCTGKLSTGATPTTSTGVGTNQSSTTPPNPANANATGTTTTNTTTTINGGNVTNITTTTYPDGSSKTDTTDKPVKTFCEENPNASVCKEVDAGNAPDITKDNIYHENFQQDDFKNAVSGFVSTIQNAGFYQGLTNFFTVNIGGGSCSGLDYQFTLMSHTFDASMSSVFCGQTANTAYEYLKFALMLGASYVAVLWAFF